VGLRDGVASRLQEALLHLLLLAVAALLAWITVTHDWHWDWTDDGRNTLSPESRALVGRLEDRLAMISFAPDDAGLRGRILRLLERYRRERPERVEIRFVDPELRPDLAREAGVTLAGELVLEYRGRRERLQTLSEGHIANALQRLLGRADRWIGVVTGHGERSFDGVANHDLGQLGTALEHRGYRIEPLDLVRTPVIPDNLSLLVVAGPQTRLPAAEVERLRRHLEGGGNLLWLMDPDGLQGLDALAADLGVRRLPGVVLDANAHELGVDDPTVVLVSRYPDHPALSGLDLVSLFPRATALESVAAGGWRATPLLETQHRTWNETGPVQGEVRPDPEQGERRGPLTLGIALERTRATPSGAREQRAVVVGDGDFLANAFLGNAGNQELGLRLVRWLAEEDELLHLPPRETRDRHLELTRGLALVLGVGTLFVLPLAFLAAGLFVRWRRGRA
jgi:ABC-type uncharacterized transport system involved in gliding motility auxiliary subunit